MAAAVGANAYGLDADLFTRGTGDDKPRGESMVQKHLEKMQQEKENMAMEKLAVLMPQLGAAVRAVALKEAVFDVETALNLLRAFQSQNDEQIQSIHKKRKKVKEAEAAAVKQAEEDAARDAASSSSSSSGSEDSSGSDSGDSADSELDRKRRRKDSKRKRSSKEASRSKSSRRSSKRKHGKDKDRSDRKRSKRSKDDKPKSLTASENFGRFGIIRETDAYAKRSEFTLWAMEVKKQDVELLGRNEEKELFRDYMEDYNTGTLPHRKFYNLEIYEREKAAKAAAKHGKKATKTAKQVALDDERALRQQREEERAKLAAERMQAAYVELQATDKARDMREQEMLRLQMQAAYKTGDTKKAQQLFERLMPDEEKKAKGIMK